MYAGQIIRAFRQIQGLSQAALASRMGTPRTYLAGIESGMREPGLIVLRKAASALCVPVALLLAGERTAGTGAAGSTP